MPNPAAAEGWVKSKDPSTGRVFYANHVTRKTQWDAPSNWIEDSELPPPPPSFPTEEPLPSNWEVMHDPSTGRPFYVDHARQITTWTRPTAKSSPSTAPSPPAQSSYTNNTNNSANRSSAALKRVLSRQSSSSSTSRMSPYSSAITPGGRSWDAAAYYLPTHQEVDLSDSMPALDFRVKKVADALRLVCAAPSCDVIFTMSCRRHHCRLCGDVFCHDCSTHKKLLPLEGPEFEKPVRVCDLCNEDIEKGNFFSMRRYLTPLTLFDPNKHKDGDDEEEGGVATSKSVAAALSALTSDLDGMLQNSQDFATRMTIPPDVLVPAITKHLSLSATSDRAVRAVASLLAMGSIVGNMGMAQAVYLYGGRRALDDILALLERSGSDRKTLYVQEQAARAIFYLTDASVLSRLDAKQSQLQDNHPDEDFGGVECLDIQRALRNMLDHSSVSKNPNLQRWAASSIRNLVLEDQRRTTLAANDVAATVAAGEDVIPMAYESFLDQLISNGGVMILSSLIAADDPDTRAHATGALGAILEATRAIDGSMDTLYEMTGGQAGAKQSKDGDIIRAIVNSGGCGSSLSGLLLSADNSVAEMGCSFCSSLVMPLLEDPRGTVTLSSGYDCRNDHGVLAACREAALAMASGSCVPALLSLMRDPELGGRTNRPMELKKTTMETLAAITMAVGEMGKANPDLTADAIAMLTDEGVIPVMLAVLDSSSSQTLSSHRDTPSSRIRECAGIVLSSMAMCSVDAMVELQSSHAITSMLAAMSDSGMAATSTLRGDGAPRCLGMLLTAAALLTFSQHDTMTSSELMDRLLEAVDAGAISTLSRILFSKMDWESQDKAVGAMKARDACCRMLCAMFGIAQMDESGMAQRRLYDVVDADAHHRKPARSVVMASLGVLQISAGYARNSLIGAINASSHYQAALMDLVESSLLAVGSMCGSAIVPGMEHHVKSEELLATPKEDEFTKRRQEASNIACDILVKRSKGGGALLPTMLVGGFGENTAIGALRLALAIAQNGGPQQHGKLATSGILVPISDALRSALSGGDLFKFSACLALVRFCGPHVGTSQNGGLKSVQEAIRVATNVLTLPVDPHQPMERLEMQESLKASCISTLEALSKNASLWSSISKDALPSVITYLHSSCDIGESVSRKGTRCAALRAVVQIVQLPSHAVSAARAGLADPLARLLTKGSQGTALEDGDDEMPLLALEVLNVIALNAEARRVAGFLESGVIEAVCFALANSATNNPKKPSDGRADVTFWGLEILHLFLSDLEGGGGIHAVLQSPMTSTFIETIARAPGLIKALCATLLLKTNMAFARFDDSFGGVENFQIPKLYGPALVMVKEACAGYKDTHTAGLSLLFNIVVFVCASESNASTDVWNTMLLAKKGGRLTSSDESSRLAATMCAYFLGQLLEDEKSPFSPSGASKQEEFRTLSRPLVRHQLLEGLKSFLVKNPTDAYMTSMLVAFEVPRVCLSIWQDPALTELAFDIIKIMVDSHEEDLIHIFVESKRTLLSLFEMLNADAAVEATSEQVGEIRKVVASILGLLAESGLLTESVEKFDVKSSAISALAAACLSDEGKQDDDDDQVATSATMSSRCMACLVELCTVEVKGKKTMQLGQIEAEAIAHRLGRKICQMVISRFIERAKLKQYDVEDEDDVMEAPYIKLLCSIAQHSTALKIIASIGGMHALSLIASEGELSAVIALKKACEEDPSILIGVQGHVAVMKLISEDEPISWPSEEARRKIETAVFELLSDLCSNSKSRRVVADAVQCQDCIMHAAHVVGSLVQKTVEEVPAGNEEVEEAGSDENAQDEHPQEKNDDDDDSDDGSDDGSDDDEVRGQGADITAQTLPPATIKQVSYKMKPLKLKSSLALESAALAFLARLVGIEKCRLQLFGESDFMPSLKAVAKDSSSFRLQLQTTTFLANIAPHAKSSEGAGDLTTADLADAFAAVIKLPAQTGFEDATNTDNVNTLKTTAAKGLGVVLDDIKPEDQVAVMGTVTTTWVALVKKHTIARTAGVDRERTFGAMLAYNLSSLLLRSAGNKSLRATLTGSDFLKSLVHLVEWRYDPKATFDGMDQIYWDGAVSNSIQMLSAAICSTEESHTALAISIRSMCGIVLMMARPGKAPRKTADFVTTLRRVVESKRDAASVLAAQGILDRLID